MSRIQLENVTKKFGKVTALDGVSLDIKDKEFFVLFGPAGAGKTTILNCIAGIQLPEEGVIKFDGKVENLTDAAHRDTAMVFENYALYPQMTVYDNMASPLRSKLYKRDEEYIKKKITEVAEMMKMDYLLERLPSQLSNGQKQRVAMGRALVRSPRVYLMDEPLAHLDAKLRTQMRVELAGIHKALGNTIIYVTHDQTEAMTLGDRIVVMNQGVVQQADTPQNLYDYPVNRFVAGFIGSPSMNFIKGLVMEKAGIPTFCTENDGDIPIPDFLWKILKRQGYIGRNIEFGIRPEHFLEKPAQADTRGEWKMEVTVTARELLGAEVILHFNHNGQDCCAKVSGDSLIDKGDKVTLWIDMAYISAFDLETQENITLRKGSFS